MYSYNENYLMCDGAPILPVMGEFHFSRYPKEEWESALYNMKCGRRNQENESLWHGYHSNLCFLDSS